VNTAQKDRQAERYTDRLLDGDLQTGSGTNKKKLDRFFHLTATLFTQYLFVQRERERETEKEGDSERCRIWLLYFHFL